MENGRRSGGVEYLLDVGLALLDAFSKVLAVVRLILNQRGLTEGELQLWWGAIDQSRLDYLDSNART